MSNQLSQTDLRNLLSVSALNTELENSTAIIGTDANDRITGTTGDDLIVGGLGDDALNGKQGSDTYVFSKGDGIDTISESGAATDIDRIVFTDVLSTEISLGYTSNSLVINYGNGDKIIIYNFNKAQTDKANTVIEQFEFLDRTLTIQELLAENTLIAENESTTYRPVSVMDASYTMVGGDGKDILNFTYMTVGAKLSGGKGEDTIYGGSGDDVLDGGDDNDVLAGYDGNDVIIGGKGNDSLHGGGGNDTYVFSKGDGEDIILDKGSLSFADRIVFTDVKSTEVTYSLSGRFYENLVINYGDNDSITIQDHYKTQIGTLDSSIESIYFADGLVSLNDFTREVQPYTSDISEILSSELGGNIDLSAYGIQLDSQDTSTPTQPDLIYPPVNFGLHGDDLIPVIMYG